MPPKKTTPPPVTQKRWLPLAIILGVLVVVVAAGWFIWRDARGGGNTSGATRSDVNNASTTGGATSLPTTAPLTGATPPHVKGAAQAPVTIEEFADLQCPSCSVMNVELQKVMSEYGSRVRLIFRHLPLTDIHRNALAAALATEAAAQQNKFWEMQDYLYRNQQAWSNVTDVRPLFYEYARTLGLDADRFMRDLRGAEALQRVRADARRALALGVNGTPTLYLNGRQLAASEMTENGLRLQIDAALNAPGR